MDGIENYEGSEKFAFVSFSRRDKERVSRIIATAATRGVRIWTDESCSPLNAQSSEKMGASEVCILFLSRMSVCSHAFRSTLTAAVESEKAIAAVYLEKVEFTLCQKLQLARAEIFNAAEISSPEKIADLLISEGVFESCCENPAFLRKRFALTQLSRGERIEISKEEFSIGRSEAMTDYSVAGNAAISRLHIIIKRTDEGCVVIDQNSSNKTYINGKELLPMVEYPLRSGDEVTLADEKFLFEELES